MKTVKHSIAAVIQADDDRGTDHVLLVRRPPDDRELPDVWGLPAASLGPGESWEDAVRRIGREKLGVRLEPGSMWVEGTIERADHLLHMKLVGAALAGGEPEVPQPVARVTQYVAWKWGAAPDLVPAARRGSLCSRLYLRHFGRGWTGRAAPPE